MKYRRYTARFYTDGDLLLTTAIVDVIGDGFPCFKIPEGAVYVVIKVEELANGEKGVEK